MENSRDVCKFPNEEARPPVSKGSGLRAAVSVLRPASLFWEYIAGDALNPLLALVFRRKSATVLNFLWEPKRCSVV